MKGRRLMPLCIMPLCRTFLSCHARAVCAVVAFLVLGVTLPLSSARADPARNAATVASPAAQKPRTNASTNQGAGTESTNPNDPLPWGYLKRWVGREPRYFLDKDRKDYPILAELPENQSFFADRNVNAAVRKTFDKELATIILEGWSDGRGTLDFPIRRQGDVLWWYKCKVGSCQLFDGVYTFINMRTKTVQACAVLNEVSYWASAKGRRKLPPDTCLRYKDMDAYVRFSD